MTPQQEAIALRVAKEMYWMYPYHEDNIKLFASRFLEELQKESINDRETFTEAIFDILKKCGRPLTQDQRIVVSGFYASWQAAKGLK